MAPVPQKVVVVVVGRRTWLICMIIYSRLLIFMSNIDNIWTKVIDGIACVCRIRYNEKVNKQTSTLTEKDETDRQWKKTDDGVFSPATGIDSSSTRWPANARRWSHWSWRTRSTQPSGMNYCTSDFSWDARWPLASPSKNEFITTLMATKLIPSWPLVVPYWTQSIDFRLLQGIGVGDCLFFVAA